MPGDRILVVDDEPGVREALEAILRDEGYDVVVAASGEEGLDRAADVRPDAMLLDVWLPGIDGIETLVRLRDRRLDPEVVMISGHATIDTAVRATKLGAFDFVEKPLSIEKTLLVLRNALRQRRLERRNRRLLEQLGRDTEVLGHSEPAERLRASIAAAAGSDAPVLVVGEPGSGRETVARRIHAASARSEEAFVTVTCAALDEREATAALFGTGAGPGRLSLARRGSLFLEDVERLAGPVQTRLAAALGSDELEDVRPLASVAAAADGPAPALRARLEVLRIDVPPLRERREDVPEIAERLLREMAREYGRPAKRLSPASLETLASAGWPGNLRELRSVVERLVLLTPGEIVRPEDLRDAIGGSSGTIEDLYRDFPSLGDGLRAFERYYLRRILREERGDWDTAARRLGMDAPRLEARLRELGEEP